MSLTLAARCRVLCLISSPHCSPRRAVPTNPPMAPRWKPPSLPWPPLRRPRGPRPQKKPAPAAEAVRASEPAHAPSRQPPVRRPLPRAAIRWHGCASCWPRSSVRARPRRLPARTIYASPRAAAMARPTPSVSRGVALAARRAPAVEVPLASPARPVHWKLRRRSRPGGLGRAEARIRAVRDRQAPEPDRHPRRHRGAARRGQVRLSPVAASA